MFAACVYEDYQFHPTFGCHVHMQQASPKCAGHLLMPFSTEECEARNVPTTTIPTSYIINHLYLISQVVPNSPLNGYILHDGEHLKRLSSQVGWNATIVRNPNQILSGLICQAPKQGPSLHSTTLQK